MRLILGLAAACLLSAWPLPAPAQQSLWQAQFDAGCDDCSKGDYAAGEKEFRAAMKEAEGFGADNPLLALTIDCLGRAVLAQGKIDEADKLINRAYTMRKRSFKEDCPQIAMSLDSLGLLKEARGKYAEAEKYMRSAVGILEAAIKSNSDAEAGLNAWSALCGGLGGGGEEFKAAMVQQAERENEQMKGQLEGTVADLKRVLEEKANPPKRDANAGPAPDDAETKARSLLSMAEQFAKNKMPEKAIEKLNDLIKRYPNAAAAKDAQRLLDQIQADQTGQPASEPRGAELDPSDAPRPVAAFLVRTEGKRNAIKAGGGSEKTEQAVLAALGWLARHQNPDGGWSGAGFVDRCSGSNCGDPGEKDYDAGVTGLALLAFLGAGYTPVSRGEVNDPITHRVYRLGDVVKNAVDWLLNNQGPDGCIGPKVSKMVYNQSICALALSEAYGMTGTKTLKEPAQKAIDFLFQARNPGKAWRYTPKCGENDTSVTGWCVMALKSAELSGLNVGRSTLVEAKRWLDDVTDKNYGKVGYTSLEDAGVKVVIPGKNEDYTYHEVLAAVGMVVRTFVDHDRKDPILEMGAKLLANDSPVWDQEKKTNDYYYWYYGTLALFQFDGPDSGGEGKYWKGWNMAVIRALVKNQRSADAGCAEGSWDADDRWGFEGGRVYATAINALTMEVYYRYPHAFGAPK